MPRAINNVASRKRRKKVLKSARGYWGGRSRLLKTAKEAVEHAWKYSYRDRRVRKRDFRSLWIVRINAAVRPYGLSYSRFIHLLDEKGITLSRKVLADLAVSDTQSFSRLVENIQKNES